GHGPAVGNPLAARQLIAECTEHRRPRAGGEEAPGVASSAGAAAGEATDPELAGRHSQQDSPVVAAGVRPLHAALEELGLDPAMERRVDGGAGVAEGQPARVAESAAGGLVSGDRAGRRGYRDRRARPGPDRDDDGEDDDPDRDEGEQTSAHAPNLLPAHL